MGRFRISEIMKELAGWESLNRNYCVLASITVKLNCIFPVSCEGIYRRQLMKSSGISIFRLFFSRKFIIRRWISFVHSRNRVTISNQRISSYNWNNFLILFSFFDWLSVKNGWYVKFLVLLVLLPRGKAKWSIIYNKIYRRCNVKET